MIRTFLEDEIGVSLQALGLDDNAGTDVDNDQVSSDFAFEESEPEPPEHGGPRRAEGDDD
jgi:hypothetical protein